MRTQQELLDRIEIIKAKYFQERAYAISHGEVLYGYDEVLTLLDDIKILLST